MSPQRHALAAAALVAAGLTCGASARAESADPAAADALFRKGREAAERGDWAVACPKFAESQRLDPAPGTLLNLADCEEHLGQLASSYEHFKTALETMAPSDDRIPFARQHMASVEKNVPHLTLDPSPDLPAHARVMRDDVQLGSASFGIALPVDPGTHAIVVSAPGRVDRRVVVTLRPGDAQVVTLKAGDVEAATAVPPGAPERIGTLPPPDLAPAPASDPRRAIGAVVGAVGILGVGAGAVAGALVLGKKSIVNDPSHCDQVTRACDQTGTTAASDGKTLSLVSTVGFAAGGALLVTGIVVFLTGGSGGSSRGRPAGAVVAPDAYPGGGGLRVIGTF